MEYIINVNDIDFQIILFEFDGKNWEICLEPNKNDSEIKLSIMKRVDELTNEFLLNGDYEKSDLYVDYIKKDEN
jgi:beta-lactamase superfamily II metal-dependent hydrolase